MIQALERSSSIEQVAEANASFYPGFDLVSFFEAGMPVYKVLIKISVLQERNLPIVSEYVLKMIDSGITQPDEIARWLGIPESHVYSAAAELLRGDILAHDSSQRLMLSSKGRSTLNSLSLKVPQIVGMSIMMNALTGTLEPWAAGLMRGSTIRRLRLTALSPYQPKPSVSTLSFNSLKTLVRQLKREKNEQAPPGDLLDLVSVERVFTEYRKLHVLVYQEQNGPNFEFLVFDGLHRMRDEEQFLRRMERSGLRVVPTERERVLPQINVENLVDIDLKEATETAVRYAELREEHRVLKQRLESAKDILENVDDVDDNTEERGRVLELEDKAHELEGVLLELESGSRLLTTFERRPLMERAISEARETLIVVSPWLRRIGLDEDLLGKVELSLQKGVRVFVGYGNNVNEGQDRWQDAFLLDHLREIQKKPYGSRLVLRHLPEVSTKCVISDRVFFVASSFEWISFRGDDSRPLLQEKGVYCGESGRVTHVHDRVLSWFAE